MKKLIWVSLFLVAGAAQAEPGPAMRRLVSASESGVGLGYEGDEDALPAVRAPERRRDGLLKREVGKARYRIEAWSSGYEHPKLGVPPVAARPCRGLNGCAASVVRTTLLTAPLVVDMGYKGAPEALGLEDSAGGRFTARTMGVVFGLVLGAALTAGFVVWDSIRAVGQVLKGRL